MFLDHIITKDHAYLEDYKDIKKHLTHKGGKIPRWYQFLKDNITINNQGRLYFDLDRPIIQNPSAPRPAIPPVDPITLHHPKKSQQWVATWTQHLSDITYGKLMSTSHFPNCLPVSYLEHWIHKDLTFTLPSTTPRSLPNIITKCQGCAQHFTYYVGNLRPKCIIQVKHQDLILIDAFSKKKREELSPRPAITINSFQLLKYSHPHYRLLAFNDFLLQQGHNSTVDFRLIAPPSLNSDSVIRSSTNDKLITCLIDDIKIAEDMKVISINLSSFTILDIYTDGSYDPTNIHEGFPMGYGWTTSNLTGTNITYNGSLRFFPSSTKAETMAILTALITRNLHSISPRLFNKINNNILWSAIHHIIKTLNLTVKLIKVKAHSGNIFNDAADVQAKLGHLQPIPTGILYDHLSNQAVTLKWNNEIPIDKDICKCISTILNYRRLDLHLNHPSLKFIKKSTKDSLIDWSLSSKWFHYNGCNDTTSIKHTKDLKWKIQCSTLSLPTLDVLNRNFPLLIKDRVNCLLCNEATESNEHLWICNQNYGTIRNCFVKIGDRLIELIENNGEKQPRSVRDSIRSSNTFRLQIKLDIWKVRNNIWKTIRSDWGLTKKHFIKYRETFLTELRTLAAVRRTDPPIPNDRERGYINPFNDFRNFKLDKDFLFILFSSSNFLHSGAFFTHLDGVQYVDNLSYRSLLNYSIYIVTPTPRLFHESQGSGSKIIMTSFDWVTFDWTTRV
ncbi:hypothetical protein RhiirB3_438036 [Rhizophagus irregularis]|nr:hypothetical protein RhiirB3_438036 [Rhizophagus irregularis]